MEKLTDNLQLNFQKKILKLFSIRKILCVLLLASIIFITNYGYIVNSNRVTFGEGSQSMSFYVRPKYAKSIENLQFDGRTYILLNLPIEQSWTLNPLIDYYYRFSRQEYRIFESTATLLMIFEGNKLEKAYAKIDLLHEPRYSFHYDQSAATDFSTLSTFPLQGEAELGGLTVVRGIDIEGFDSDGRFIGLMIKNFDLQTTNSEDLGIIQYYFSELFGNQ